MKQVIRTNKAPQPVGPYSQGLKNGNRVYVSGQGPLDAKTGKVTGDTIEEQTLLTMNHIQCILQEAGATMEDVVKVNVHLSDLADFKAFNDVYKTFFSEPYPVRTTVGSELLGIKVEIDVIAEVDGK